MQETGSEKKTPTANDPMERHQMRQHFEMLMASAVTRCGECVLFQSGTGSDQRRRQHPIVLVIFALKSPVDDEAVELSVASWLNACL